MDILIEECEEFSVDFNAHYFVQCQENEGTVRRAWDYGSDFVNCFIII